MAIITISRGTMSGGEHLAEMLADRLNYRCISREVLVRAADNYEVPERKLYEAIQKGGSLIQKLTFDRDRYVAYVRASLCEYAAADNLVYHGHAGHFLLEGVSHVLSIRILADMAYRIDAAMTRRGLTEKEAVKYIGKVDKERVKWTRLLYGQDWRSPELYDIVFRLKKGDLEFVCAMVCHAVAQPCFQTTPESARAMQNLLTVARVRAALAGIANVRLDQLDVQADGGAVTIGGRTQAQEFSDAIQKEAMRVPGVERVESQMEVDYRSYGIE